MNNFWTLVGFEFQKMRKRRVVIPALFACLGVVAVMAWTSVSGTSFWHKAGSGLSQYEAMKRDKEVILSQRGEITGELVSQAICANEEMISDDSHYLINEYGRHLKSDAYIQYALPYEAVVRLINTVYEEDSDWLSTGAMGMISVNPDRAIDHLTPEQGQSFDRDFKEFAMSVVMGQEGLSAEEVEKNAALISQIETPLYNDYFGGYQAYINDSKVLALTALFVILILLAPLFSGEYEDKTDQLLLCARNGRGTLCRAKIAAALMVSLGVSLLTMGAGWLCFLMIFGFEGGAVSIQVVNPGCTYPITLFQACLIHLGSVVAAAVLFGAFTAFLSARARRGTASAVAAGTMAVVLPLFIWVPLKSSRFLYNLLQFFPANSVTFGFDLHFFRLFGTLIEPYKWVGAVSLLLAAGFFVLAARGFQRRQA